MKKASSQGRVSVAYITMELDSHADTIVCVSKCIIMHFLVRGCDVAPYTGAYENIKSLPIVQASTAYNNHETGEITIIFLNKAICMGKIMYHTLVNLNQLSAYGMIVQDNPFSEALFFIATEDHDFMIPFSSKGTILGVATRTPTDKELHTVPHVTCLSAHEWDPHYVCFPKSSRTVEE